MAESCDLHELNMSSATIGTWILRVYAPRLIHYEYHWQGQPRKGAKVECHLAQADGIYIQDMIKARPADPEK